MARVPLSIVRNVGFSLIILLGFASLAAAQPVGAIHAHPDEEVKCKPFVTNPASVLDFGTIEVGTSKPQNVVVTNPDGNPTVMFHSASTSGAPFTVNSIGCDEKSLKPKASCTLVATFSPTQVGKAVKTLTADYSGCPDANSGMFTTIKLRGVGAACKDLEITPDPDDFGNVVVNTTENKGVTIENPAANPTITIAIVAPGHVGERSNPFRTGDNCERKQLAPGLSVPSRFFLVPPR